MYAYVCFHCKAKRVSLRVFMHVCMHACIHARMYVWFTWKHGAYLCRLLSLKPLAVDGNNLVTRIDLGILVVRGVLQSFRVCMYVSRRLQPFGRQRLYRMSFVVHIYIYIYIYILHEFYKPPTGSTTGYSAEDVDIHKRIHTYMKGAGQAPYSVGLHA